MVDTLSDPPEQFQPNEIAGLKNPVSSASAGCAWLVRARRPQCGALLRIENDMRLVPLADLGQFRT